MNEAFDALLTQHDITVTSVFVPWSQSRNKNEKDRSLNWLISIHRKGRLILTTDYMAGIGHCPSYKQGARWTLDYTKLIEAETEQGFAAHKIQLWSQPAIDRKKPILPDTAGVIHSLYLDYTILDSSGFEDWASELGYDTDSRKAEKMYRDCLELALKIRAGFGDELIRELGEVADA
jgi:hypothetical protein